ncbi:MAG: hypothetical protein AAF629_10610 [Chloroflexota bacterium]
MGKKIFYTERDIELLVEQGVTHLHIHDDIVITDLAREKATQLGLVLVDDESEEQASSFAPNTTNVTKLETHEPKQLREDTQPTPTRISHGSVDLAAKVKAVVLAQIGHRVSEDLIDTVIGKVLAQLKLENR